MQDEQFSSDELPLLPPRRYFAPKWLLGAVAGIVAGLTWGVVAGCFLFDFDEFLKPYFFLYLAAVLASMTATGVIMGLVRKLPELYGVLIGAGSATVLFVAFWSRYLQPPFGILMVMFVPPLGTIGGLITGVLLRLLTFISHNR